MRWFGHVRTKDCECIDRKMPKMEQPGRRQRGKPKRRIVAGVREDMQIVRVTKEDTDKKERWRRMIHSGEKRKYIIYK